MLNNSVNGKRLAGFILLSLLAALILTTPLFAQTSNGTIAGVVTDQTGASVTNATVAAKSEATGDSRTVHTNSVGAYRIESLIPGVYNLTVKAESFSTTSVQSIQVVGTVVTSINATLKPGAASQTVEVQATAEALQTESGEISHTISQTEISTVPISSLNPYSLAVTLPGVVTTSSTMSFSNGTNFSVNGTRVQGNNFLIEGQDNNDMGIRGQGLQPQNVDAIQEVSIQTNSYAAEFGNGGGSVNNLLYKTGSNTLHGAVWNTLQNSSLDATDKYYVLNDIPKDKYRENTYGYSIGGRVVKNKLFFFNSWQWDKYRSSTSGGTITLPTAAGVASLQTLLPNPRIANLLAAIGTLRGQYNISSIALVPNPVGGAARPSIEVGQVNREGIANNNDNNEFIAKGDYIASSKDTLNLRFVRSYNSSPYDLFNWAYQLPGFDTMQSGPAYNAGITETHTFNSHVLNEFRMSYGRIGFSFGWRPETVANPLAYLPTTTISGLTGLTFGSPSGNPQGRFHNTVQTQDAVSWQTGKHSFKFGFDVADVRVADTIPYNTFGSLGYASSTGYSGLSNYIDDFGGKSSTTGITIGTPRIHTKMFSQAYYGQDTWKLQTNLTLTLGLRYEYFGAPSNSLPYPAINMATPNAAYPFRYPQLASATNFGPRGGLAYTPHFWKSVFGEDKTVIRAGFGIFYDPMFTNLPDNTASTSPNSIAPSATSIVSAGSPRGAANWSAIFAGLSPVLSPLASVTTIRNHLISPETLQWNFDIQRKLPGDLTLTTGYIGTRGMYLYGQDQLNPVDANTGLRIMPTRGSIVVRDNSGDSIYHALNVKAERPLAHGLMLRTSYTWSKNIDDVSEFGTAGNFSGYPIVQWPFGVPRGTLDRGPSAFDRRQRLAITYVYEIPKWQASGILSAPAYLVNHWEISGTTAFQTGSPGNVMLGEDNNGDGISNDRPNLSNVAAPLATYAFDMGGGALCEGAQLWNNGVCHSVSPSAVHWIVPEGVGNGNFGRNALQLPGTQSWNFSISRHFKLTERHQLDFRTDFFNVFNQGNTGIPNLTLTSGIPASGTISFGDLSQTLGGSRNIRFKLKYSF